MAIAGGALGGGAARVRFASGMRRGLSGPVFCRRFPDGLNESQGRVVIFLMHKPFASTGLEGK